MSWYVGMRDNDSNSFSFNHSPSGLEALVIRDRGGDIWDPVVTKENEDGTTTEYSIGLAFTIKINDTVLSMMPDGSKGWIIKAEVEHEDVTNLLDADDVVELIQLLLTLIKPENRNGETYKDYI
jgi:hypothetical protein